MSPKYEDSGLALKLKPGTQNQDSNTPISTDSSSLAMAFLPQPMVWGGNFWPSGPLLQFTKENTGGLKMWAAAS